MRRAVAVALLCGCTQRLSVRFDPKDIANPAVSPTVLATEVSIVTRRDTFVGRITEITGDSVSFEGRRVELSTYKTESGKAVREAPKERADGRFAVADIYAANARFATRSLNPLTGAALMGLVGGLGGLSVGYWVTNEGEPVTPYVKWGAGGGAVIGAVVGLVGQVKRDAAERRVRAFAAVVDSLGHPPDTSSAPREDRWNPHEEPIPPSED